MKTNSVSFGHIIKVNAPLDIADDIAEIANLNRRGKISPLAKEIYSPVEKAFNDITPLGDAFAYSSSINSNVSYIFTGFESEEAQQFYTEMIEETDRAENYYGAGDLFEFAAEDEVEKMHEKTQMLIKKGQDYELDVNYKDKEIKSLGIK